MSAPATVVTNAAELSEALGNGTAVIEVQGTITGSPMITLAPGVTLRGGTLRFGGRGVRLTADNTLEDITVETPDTEAAVLNDTGQTDLGTLVLRNVTTRGQVFLLAADAVRTGHVRVETLHVAGADVRGRFDRPHGFGVDVLQGAFTLWNRQPDTASVITAELLDISAGSADNPVRGSGVFVGGHGNSAGLGDGGTVQVTELRTGEVHSDGGIPEATPDLISGGVFVVSGGVVEHVVDTAAVTTYGPNDMVLDNWGEVSRWTATAPVTSHGPSGIGFVQFGAIDKLDVQAPVLTTGDGARGFNLYDGTLGEARFTDITTTGDGSIGVQISKPLGALLISGDVTTSGGTGLSLVKGVQLTLSASAMSVKEGGVADTVAVGGKLATSGDGVSTLELLGKVQSFSVDGGVEATGRGSDAVHIAGDLSPLDDVTISAADGEDVVRV